MFGNKHTDSTAGSGKGRMVRMYQVAYRALRPNRGIFSVPAFVIGTWAAVDQSGFVAYIKGIDISRTGALVAVSIAVWIALLLLTRNWNVSDRVRYIRQLQDHLVAHSQVYQRIIQAQTDAAFDAEAPRWEAAIVKTGAWIELNMGSAAVAKYVSGMPVKMSYPWAGQHTEEHKRRRDNVLVNVNFRIDRLNELLASDHWDDPRPLRKRKKSREWKEKLEGYRKELGDDFVRSL